MLRLVILCAALAAACKQESGADPAETETSGPAKGSAGGFSASLSAELGGSGSAGAEAAGSGLQRTASGNAPKPESETKPGSGSAATKTDAGSAAAKTDAGSAAAKTDAAKTDAGSGSAAAKTDAGSGSAAAKTDAGSGSAAAKTDAAKTDAGSGSAAAKTDAAKTGSGSGSAMAPKTEPAKAGSGAGSAVAMVVKPAIAMTPELRAIKLSLEPNWDRDVVEPGTISLFEKNSNATFKFHYGYEDPKAPADRDAYRKYLADNKILAIRTDRQSGAAWYLEGTDGNGRGAFRIVVTYGGKRLICWGSTYKDSGLGDLRDSVLVQAKKICETIQL